MADHLFVESRWRSLALCRFGGAVRHRGVARRRTGDTGLQSPDRSELRGLPRGRTIPELTPYGRIFKMTGRTIDQRAKPLLAMGGQHVQEGHHLEK